MVGSPRRPRQRRLLFILGGGALATLALSGVYHREILASIVTRMAIADAREAAAGLDPPLAGEQSFLQALQPLAEKYGACFRRGLLDRDLVAGEFPASGITHKALPALLVSAAFYRANEARFSNAAGETKEQVFAEFLLWLGPALRRSQSRELLVNLLTGDYTLFRKPDERDAGLIKRSLFMNLFSTDVELEDGPDGEFLSWRKRCLEALRPEHWEAILRDSDHPREKVRAGALLLLQLHPSGDLVAGKAVRALRDPSEWVRLAAAGTLAWRGDGRGALQLMAGLHHSRWEVRYFSGACLTVLGRQQDPPAGAILALPIAARSVLEPDAWVKDMLEEKMADKLLPRADRERYLLEPLERAVKIALFVLLLP